MPWRAQPWPWLPQTPSSAPGFAAANTRFSHWERQKPLGAMARHCHGAPSRSQGSGPTLARSPPQATSPAVALPGFPGHTTLGPALHPCHLQQKSTIATAQPDTHTNCFPPQNTPLLPPC